MDYLLIFGGIIFSIGVGVSLPIIMIVFGDMIDIFSAQGMFLALMEEHWAIIEAFYPNATEEYIIENPEVVEYVVFENFELNPSEFLENI